MNTTEIEKQTLKKEHSIDFIKLVESKYLNLNLIQIIKLK